MIPSPLPSFFSELTAADLDAVVDVENRSFERPWTRNMFCRELESEVSRTILAWGDGHQPRLLGYVCRWLILDEIQILNLAVSPEHRRQGVARALIQHVIDEGTGKGVRTITLEVRDGNEAAIRLYESFHFRKTGLRRSYYGRGSDGVLMTCRMPLERT